MNILPRQEMKTEAEVHIYSDELDDNGKEKELCAFKTMGAFYSSSETVKDVHGELTQASAVFYTDGDACPELNEIHRAEIVLADGEKMKTVAVKKARYQGKTVYTKFILQ